MARLFGSMGLQHDVEFEYLYWPPMRIQYYDITRVDSDEMFYSLQWEPRWRQQRGNMTVGQNNSEAVSRGSMVADTSKRAGNVAASTAKQA